MSWEEFNKLDQRKEFAIRAMTERISFSELCNEYGISRKTGYKWKQRFCENGYAGLSDLSKKPHKHPSQLSEDTIIQIVQLKQAHPNWGARKIQTLYEKANKTKDVPSESSIKRIFDKAGLVKKRRIRRVPEGQNTLRQMIQPLELNDVWTVDFKGWWYCEGKEKCQPLTIRDEISKHIHEIKLLQTQKTEPVKEVFQTVFKKYGLPKVIRSDNGSPFAAPNGILGLSRLSVWWMSLGILPDRITPGCPQQNGGHERMHPDLKREIQLKQRGKLTFIQTVIDEWRQEYNNIRPHESLGMQTPAEVYKRSERKYNGDIDELIYPIGFERRKISSDGMIKFNNIKIAITSALAGYYVGLNYIDSHRMSVWFNEFLLGEIDTRTYSFYAIKNRT